MSLIVLTSASGSPGVTTTALGLTLTWPRPVLLVEADPTGASAVFAGFFRGGVEPTGGLINLAVAHREGTLARSLPRETLVLDQGGAEGSAWFLPGAQSHEQAPSLVLLWEPLTTVLRSLHQHGQDVIVDAGRLGLAGWPEPLVLGADLTLLVSRNTLPSLAGARPWAKTLRDRFAEMGGLPRLGVLMVDEEQRWSARPVRAVRPYSARQVTKAVGLPVVAAVDWEPRAAEVYSHGARPPRKFDTSGLIRGYRAAAAAVIAAIRANQADLEVASTGGQQ